MPGFLPGYLSRRKLLSTFVGALAGLPGRRGPLEVTAKASVSPANLGSGVTSQGKGPALLNNRFLTFGTVVRVNQIEAARGQDLGHDETALHTPQAVAAFRNAFSRGWPGGRITWALSWRALRADSAPYKAVRKLVAEYHARFGDEVTFIPGGYFANVYNTRELVNRDLHEGLAVASAIVGGGYRPTSVIAGFLAAENQRFLAEEEGIHVCQGNVWSQFAIDNQDADGSICYPYYPSKEHFCKPAQSRADFIDCVNLDGFTCDFLAARRAGFTGGFNSRMGIGPLETIYSGPPSLCSRYYNREAWRACVRQGLEKGLREVLHTTAIHFDTGFELNGFAWVTNIWEIAIGSEGLADWLSAIRERWPDTHCITHGEFGLLWRAHFRDNLPLNYRFVERGSGIGGSDADKEIRWFMRREFRLALLRSWREGGEERVIDFTRYDCPTQEPRGLTRNWSLMGQINQKQTRPQDLPVAMRELPLEDQQQIVRGYPELSSLLRSSV